MRTYLVFGLLLAVVAPQATAEAADATLLRLFLFDGTALVSYGEFARLDDRVVFSMPVGGSGDEPRLQVVSIPVTSVDWPRTDRYVASARYQQYASTRGEEDFAKLSADVARVLNTVALTNQPQEALKIAEQARKTLADWTQAHYGYRQRDVREIVGLLDEAISDLRAAAGVGSFELTLVAMAADVPLEPVLGLPPPRDMVSQLIAVATLAERSSDRISLLQSAITLINEAAASIPDADRLREMITGQIRREVRIDEQYDRLARRSLNVAARASALARVTDVEAVLNRITREDRKLGNRRPDVVQGLTATVRGHLEAARKLRLLRDQWMVRRSAYREYERSVSSNILQLVKAQPALDAIKRLDGPPPEVLSGLRMRLQGGAERLSRTTVPQEVRGAHNLLVSAWQFAETAIRTRQDAIGTGDMAAAWRASSAAAGALMTLSRLQLELRSLLEPPQLR